MKVKDTLNLIAFIFTILIISYGIHKGLDNIELIINFLYFAVLLLSQIENLREIVLKSK
jgi:hypothetical protein